MEYPHKTGKIDIFGDEVWVFTPEAENDPYYSITFDSIEEWKKGASFSDGGYVDSVRRRFTDNDYGRLIDSGEFKASRDSNFWTITKIGETRKLGKYNPEKEYLYILGKKDLSNPLVKWLSQNSFVSNDEYNRLEGGGVVQETVLIRGKQIEFPKKLKIVDNKGKREYYFYNSDVGYWWMIEDDEWHSIFNNEVGRYKGKLIGYNTQIFKRQSDSDYKKTIQQAIIHYTNSIARWKYAISKGESPDEIERYERYIKEEEKMLSDFKKEAKKHHWEIEVGLYYENGGGVGKKTFIKRVKQMHNDIDEVILKDGTHINGKDLMEDGGGVADLSFEKRSLAKPKESILMSKLYNGEIPTYLLELIIGRKPNYPNEYVGSIKLEKCFMKKYYRILK